MSGTQFDDPNREAVGLPPAWVEGTGGDGGGAVTPSEAEAEPSGLSSMTKAQLLDEAASRGIDADDTMTKAELVAVLGG